MSVKLESVEKSFGATHAVAGVDLDVRDGELVAVLGPSGCGKTTLLRLIAGFEAPDAGVITVGAEVVADGARAIAPERRRIGMVFQDYALFPHLRVRANVEFGLSRHGADERAALSKRTLELVSLQHKADRYPHELSGGERQRVALARALAPEPAIVLLDEPFSSLDASLRAELRREVELILRDAGATALLVTHDQEEALTLADRLAVMRDGALVQVDAPEAVYSRPVDRWAAEFVGEVNVLPGMARAGKVATDLGSFAAPAVEDGRRVHVAIRPEQLELRRDEHGNAEIVQREFRGHDVLYRLRHEEHRTVIVQLPSVDLFEVGESVFVRPVPAAAAPVVE